MKNNTRPREFRVAVLILGILGIVALAAHSLRADPVPLVPAPTPEPVLIVDATFTPEQAAVFKSALISAINAIPEEHRPFVLPEGVSVEQFIGLARVLSFAQPNDWSLMAFHSAIHNPAFPTPTPPPAPE